jgi:mRNA interferase RelE/StbE
VRAVFRSSFVRDLRKVKDRAVLEAVRKAIEDVEAASHLQSVRNLRKLSGGGSFYSIRIGDYRLGIVVSEDEVEFVRCLHRRDVYRYFP